MSTTKTKIIKYALLPGFLPRINALFTSGFAHIAYLIAVIYESLKLLPPNHPYLNPVNKGRYGVRHVIAQAANNLVFSRKNIDQIIVFFTILLGLVLLISQFVLFGVSLFAQQELLAAPVLFPTMTDLLSVNSQYGHGAHGGEAQDIAFILLDRVFGVEGIFNSCISQIGVDCVNLKNQVLPTPGAYPFPFHIALHSLLHFYSLGIFLVSVFIIIYFITTVVAETAATGTPFGQRTNRAWAPVRLILFFAMLAPLNVGGINGGLNAAQLITLWTAKAGSNFATNAWGYFNATLGNSQLIAAEEMVASPSAPNVSDLVAFMFVAKTCQNIEEKAHFRTINGYVIIPGDTTPRLLEATNLDTIHNLTNNGNILISFGIHDTGDPNDPENKEGYKKYLGAVNPLCGQVTIPIDGELNDYTRFFEEKYYTMVQDLWQNNLMGQEADCLVKQNYALENEPGCAINLGRAFLDGTRDYYNNDLRQGIEAAVDQIRATRFDPGAIPEGLDEKGWAGAALWYNQISEINGTVMTAMANKPTVNQYPMVMETVMANRLSKNENVPGSQVFNPKLSDNDKIEYVRDGDENLAVVMYMAYKVWDTDSYAETSLDQKSGNIFVDMINAVLGTGGIFSMRQNADIHPLAQLSALGKSMMNATIRNMAAGGVLQIGGKIDEKTKEDTAKIGGAIWSLGISTITMSVILYYIIPFMPFIYFLFAVSGWVKGIFEAMVAMPLWAMAHIRIDGEGIPGRDASNGYFLLMEIFLRPILILFGLLASTIIFSSLIHVLNNIFDTVVNSVGGFDHEANTALEHMRNPVDELFYTAMYVIITYMIGLNCFKLVDLIPNNILRWSGVSVATFQEGAGDPAGQITQSVYTGGTLMISPVRGGILPALL